MHNRSLEECAVLFAIPTDRSQFVSIAQLSDYVHKLLRGRDLDTAWHSDYENVALAAQRLITTAQRLEVRVYERATRSHLEDATRRCRIVVLFAHWRGAKINASDLLAEPELFSKKLQQHPSFSNSRLTDTQSVVDSLNGAIEDMRLLNELPPAVEASARRSRSIAQTLSRDLLGEYLCGLLAPGNRLELYDGLCTPDDVDRTICPEFSGELDLALCHSEALATFLDLRRGDRIRHLYWPGIVHPLPQLLKVAATLELLAAEGGSYIEKRLFLEEAETYI
jgi:hypothetical protein